MIIRWIGSKGRDQGNFKFLEIYTLFQIVVVNEN